MPPGLASVAVALSVQQSTTDQLVRFLKQIVRIFWLDSGHSGDQGEVWITDGEILQTLSDQLTIKVYVHVSPLQINCPNRPWIGEEERLFVDTLKELGVEVVEMVHFKDESRSLLNHFRILKEF